MIQAVELLQKKHGIKQLDIVIANAAVNPSSASFKDTDMKDLDEAFRVNVSVLAAASPWSSYTQNRSCDRSAVPSYCSKPSCPYWTKRRASLSA